MSECSLWALKYTESELSEHLVFDGGSSDVSLPISFAIYLIQTENRRVLVDAGCDTMPGFRMRRFYSPAFVLREIGLCSADITDVIITHAHHDHVAALSHFENATVYIQTEEYANAKRYISQRSRVQLFDDVFSIEKNIRVVKIGGHSIGSSIVEIDHGDVTYVVAGDECYVNACIARHHPTGSSYNPKQSSQFVEKYSDSKYRVLTMHDPANKTTKIV